MFLLTIPLALVLQTLCCFANVLLLLLIYFKVFAKSFFQWFFKKACPGYVFILK